MEFKDIKYSTSKPKREINWALLISLISLSLSLFSFFFQNLRTTHLLKVCITNDIDEQDLPTDTTKSLGYILQSYQAVFHNYGNMYEAVLQTKIHYSYDDTSVGGLYVGVGEPFVIKPGEAVLKQYIDTVTMESLLGELPPNVKPTCHVFFEFLLTAKNGELFKKNMHVADINIDTINNDLNYSGEYKSVRCDELIK